MNRRLVPTRTGTTVLRYLLLDRSPSFDSSDETESRFSEYQSEIDVLVRERSSLLEQIKHLASQPNRRDVEIQTLANTDSLIRSPSNCSLASSSDQGISRRVFEEEMLAWSKESEQLKRFVKQIQIENKRLKEIILKFERMIREYIQDNERLKQELRHLSFTNPSSTLENEDADALLAADREICYLTLKWLTYEVAQRVSNSDEQSIVSTEDPEDESKQRQVENSIFF